MNVETAIRYWHTVRHLRAGQIAGRVRRRVGSLWEDPASFARRHRGADAVPQLGWGASFPAPHTGDNTCPDLSAGRFTFLNHSENLGWPPEWVRTDLPKLWRYQLHYFDYLWALDYDGARSVVGDWMARHDLRKGRVGWEPYPTSVRLMNWCGYFLGKFGDRTRGDAAFRDELRKHISLQTDWLMRTVETHLMGNHLLENAAALGIVGSCFEGPAADRWCRAGRRLLAEQIGEQILADGFHFERSPMYHLRMTYLLVVLLAAGRDGLREIVREPLGRMLSALAMVRHPDGGIALLNDSSLRACHGPGELIESAGRLLGQPGSSGDCPRGPWALPDAGYFGFRGADGSYVICDAGPIGPDYIPGHAHGDMLSFELSLGGQRVIVDAGVHDYEAGDMRRYCRSTRAHNTVEINGQDQCEFWDAFRVARRGRPRDVVWEPAADDFRLSAWHDGYRRLRGRPVHRREFVWRPGRLRIVDCCRATIAQQVAAGLHLHPDCRIGNMDGRVATILHPGGHFEIALEGSGKLSIEDSWYCPEFGVRIPNRAVVCSSVGVRHETVRTITWA